MQAAPSSLTRNGQPAHGRRIARLDWARLSPRPGWLWRRLHHKRWHYVGLGNHEVFIGVAIVDVGWAAIDASNGLLARDTAWRWASAHRPDIGFNLQQGYFGNQENVLWLDGKPMALGPAQFDFDPARPLAPWRVRTDDGLLDLVFTPEGARAADKHLGFAASRYVQLVGCFSGTVHGQAVTDLLGVTEDHRSLW